MIRIDNSLLQDLGLVSLPDAEKNGLLRHIYETLEMRVGVRLADQMSNEQLDEFERYFEAKDDAGAFKWLETNFPNYKDIVQEEFDKLKGEVSQSAPQILASSQAAAASPPPSGYQPSTTQGQQKMPATGPPQPPAYQYQTPSPLPQTGPVTPAPAAVPGGSPSPMYDQSPYNPQPTQPPIMPQAATPPAPPIPTQPASPPFAPPAPPFPISQPPPGSPPQPLDPSQTA